MAQISVRIEGSEQLRRALTGNELLRKPVRRYLLRATGRVTLRAKLKAPSDRGRLRNTITPKVLGVGLALRGRVRAGAKYAPYMEFGTKPHWPPRFVNGRPTLQPWAQRHGFPRGVRGSDIVRWIISRKGTKPQPFMEPAWRESQSDIAGFLDTASRDVEKIWESGIR